MRARETDGPFVGFLGALRSSGFDVSIERQIQLRRLLNQRNFVITASKLKLYLCPLFAESEDRQREFYRLFDLHFPHFHNDRSPEAEQVATRAAAQSNELRYMRFLLLLVVAAGALGLLFFEIQHEFNGRGKSDDHDLENVQKQPAPKKPVPTDSENQEPRSTRKEIWFPIGLAALLLANELGYKLHRRRIKKRPALSYTPPSFVTLVPSAPRSMSLFSRAESRACAQVMRIRTPGEMRIIDVEKTVAASIRALGFPELRYRHRSRPSEFLVLIEKRCSRDHLALMFEEMIESLRMEGTLVSIWYLSPPSSLCTNARQRPRCSLNELYEKFPDHNLIVMGDVTSLFDTVKGDLHPYGIDMQRWTNRTFLTPKQRRHWGPFEVAASQVFHVSTASFSSLSKIFSQVNQSYARVTRNKLAMKEIEWAFQDYEDVRSTATLRTYLGSTAFDLLGACALAPEIQWELTLRLAERVLGDELAEESAFKLFRLPWFRHGSMPPRLQQQLSMVLPTSVKRIARDTIVELLHRSLKTEDVSFAAINGRLEIVVQRWELNPIDRLEIQEDEAKTLIAASSRKDGLTQVLPLWCRKVAYRHGLPMLGVTDWMQGLSSAILCYLGLVRLLGPTPALCTAAFVAAVIAVRPKSMSLVSRSRRVRRLIPTLYEDSITKPFLQEGPVSGVAFSADGKRVVSCSQNGIAKVWDISSREELLSMSGFWWLTDVKCSHDGKWIAAASKNGSVCVWEAHNGSAVQLLVGHSAGVTKIAFSKRGDLLATVSSDRTGKVWSVARWEEILSLSGHDEKLSGVAFSPDSTVVLTSSYDGTTRVWDVATGNQKLIINHHDTAITCLAISPDGRYLATGGFDRRAMIWDLAENVRVGQFVGHKDAIYDLAYAPDGKKLATASLDGTVRMWDIETGEQSRILEYSAPVSCVAFSSDGRKMVAGKTDGSSTVTYIR